ncbi:MAG TPA: FAD-dependent oxidoreductase [Vicinamibacterales bacterium]|nr:FAD-dependent oxidoreductase [Vicinamibacterales bacterium]
MPTRRTILKLGAAPFLLGRAPLMRAAAPHVVVIGAGAFGGWSALWLARRGAQVTLIDAWGPGNMRASSGGETRVIRGSYGDRAIYTRMAARALRLWTEHELEWGRRFYVPTGALWMFGKDDSFARSSSEAMASEGLPSERLSLEEARRRWTQVSFDGISSVMFEPKAGYLFARQSCAHVVERARALGATYRITAARPPAAMRAMSSLALEGGGSIAGDVFVFACGPWLGRLLPDVIGTRVRPTRQAVFYFGPRAGDTRFDEATLPVWVDFRERLIYGIPGNAHRGFKLADDTPGPAFDPTSGERHITEKEVADARDFLRRRFPALADAPFLGGEVCQYENSPDSHFIVDRHPGASNVWIVGGGSGHGFKMGPALGEMVAWLVLSDGTPDPQFGLARFAKK